MGIRILLGICLCALLQNNADANTYAIDPEDQLVGQADSVLSRFDDTLYSVALKYRVGAEALASANPDLDPSLPGEGAELKLPMQYILPAGERVGIVINLPEMRLYHYAADGRFVSVYPVGIGRQGWETPLMQSTVSSIVENPSWTPPASIHHEFEAAGLVLPAVVPSGPENPLGEYAVRIGQTSYLIHGTNNPKGVGLRVSHGCIRLYPEHIKELAAALEVGTPVTIVNQPIKLARHNGFLHVQGHTPVAGNHYDHSKALTDFISYTERELSRAELLAVKRVMREALARGDLYTGVPIPVPGSVIQ